MRFKLKVAACVFLLFLAATLPCFVAEAKPSVTLSFYKNNGYGFGNDIGGLWTVTADVSSDVQFVEFYLDDQLQKNDTSSPFDWQFQTADHPTGPHTIRALAFDSLRESETTEVERNFQQPSTESVAGVIVAVVVVIVAVSIGFVVYRSRKAKS